MDIWVVSTCQLLWIVLLWTFPHKFLCGHTFSLGFIPSSWIAGSHRNSIFNIFRGWQTVFQSGCTILHPHQQRTRVPISPRPFQHLLFSIFLIAVVLGSVESCLLVVLPCISLMTKDVWHLFWCLFVNLLWRHVYSNPVHILLFGYLPLVPELLDFILDTDPLSNIWFANILFHPVCYLFTFLIMPFESQGFLILMKSYLSISLLLLMLLLHNQGLPLSPRVGTPFWGRQGGAAATCRASQRPSCPQSQGSSCFAKICPYTVLFHRLAWTLRVQFGVNPAGKFPPSNLNFLLSAGEVG